MLKSYLKLNSATSTSTLKIQPSALTSCTLSSHKLKAGEQRKRPHEDRQSHTWGHATYLVPHVAIQWRWPFPRAGSPPRRPSHALSGADPRDEARPPSTRQLHVARRHRLAPVSTHARSARSHGEVDHHALLRTARGASTGHSRVPDSGDELEGTDDMDRSPVRDRWH